jgi:hypothetical protein
VSAIDCSAKRIDELQKEKIDDQKEIVQLKDTVFAKKSDDLNEVKCTV